ncbi:MAG TPA: TonB-dependent receptor plug domain-containing protein, partial [Chitinophagaceae bacterium]
MFSIFRFMAMACLVLATHTTYAQVSFKGKIIDSLTGEPISGATIQCSCTDCKCGCTTNPSGEFIINNKNCCDAFQLSYIGYKTREIFLSSEDALFALVPDQSALQEVVVTANRQPVKRSEAPIAISNITASIIRDAKPSSADQVLNKVSGVYMANLGNEQHSMSIRQPITTKSLFLYLEDGIPIRTTGLFNHNALLEMNMAAVKNIEVIKGPSSSLYGSEAIGGVVNFITLAPTANPLIKLSAQANDIGYKRTDLQSSFTKGKWGFALSGYYAERKNGFIDYSDFNKGTFTVRADGQINQKTSISNSFTLMQYRSDM